MFFWLARAQDGFWLGFSKELKNSWSRTYSLLRNSLTFDYQLFSISYFCAFPALSLSQYGCAYPDLRAEFVFAWRWSQCWMLPVQHLSGSGYVKSRPCHMKQGWCRPGKDAGTSDVAMGPAVRMAKCICWQMCSWPILRLTFHSHPLPSLTLCLFPVCLRPCFDRMGQQGWSQDPAKNHIQHANASSASSGKSRTTIWGHLHFHRHCLRCIFALTVLQKHLHKMSNHFWKHWLISHLSLMLSDPQ